MAETQDTTIPSVIPVPSTCRRNLTGRIFGRLRVIGLSHIVDYKYYWLCQCECGTIKPIIGDVLTAGRSRSCGCLRDEVLSKRRKTHGMSKTSIYLIWQGMLNRCYNPNVKAFIFYGARGIEVCPAWRHSFEAFLADMGNRPSPRHSIDRIDNNGHYEPANCRWTTREHQVRNRRSNIMLTCHNKSQTATDWALEVGIPPHLILKRIRLGWTPVDAIFQPPLPRGKRLSSRVRLPLVAAQD